MKTVITILSENSISKQGIIGEHGFSLLIEKGEEKILFDTGPGMSLPHNLKALGKDLNGLNKVIISHGHHDHTGGLKWVIQQVRDVEVVAHPAVFSRHMAFDREDPSKPPRDVGCPHTQEELESMGATFNFIDHTEKIEPGLWFITEIARLPDQIPDDPKLIIPEGKQFVPDPVKDDASLLLECENSPVLILGCAHSGVLNILDHVRDKMGVGRIQAILGGTHLMFCNNTDIPRVIDKFEGFSIDLIGVSHCTGWQAAIELAKHFGTRFVMASAGTVFHFL